MRRNYKVFIFLACLPALAGAASLAPANAQSPAASSPQTVASVDYVDQSLRWCINSKCPAGRWPHAQQDQKLVYGNYVYKDKGQETGLRAASGNKTWTMAPAEQVLASVQKYVATYPPDPQTLHGNIATVTALPNVSAGLLLRRGEVYEEVLRGSVGVVQAGGAVSVADAVNDVAQLDVSVLGNRTAFTVFTGTVRVQFRGRVAFVGPGHQVIAQGARRSAGHFPRPRLRRGGSRPG